MMNPTREFCSKTNRPFWRSEKRVHGRLILTEGWTEIECIDAMMSTEKSMRYREVKKAMAV